MPTAGRLEMLDVSWRLLAVVCVLLGGAAGVVQGEEVDFDRDIQPIFAQHCYACHGPDAAARRGDLRLDDREIATAMRPGGTRAISPNDPDNSELIRRVYTDDPQDIMPPPSEGARLSEQQKQLLRDWIAQGAIYQDHWAYVPPERPELPEVGEHAAKVRNPIDHFILARLEDEQLRPSPEADRYTLIRRLHLDLTGLPPSIEAVDAFVADERPDAYERLVDKLLNDPAHGEHMARYWLDLARYADSHGYHIDTGRSIWPYRDWVIEAFNRNMPFDAFTIAQIAGDLLPDATIGQRVATGFHRNTMYNEEGGIDPEEFRTKAVVDRVNTTMTVWMGQTMSCAECHDHKYDPLSQAEFFQLYAFFNNVPETGGEPDPARSGQTPARPLLELPLPEPKQQELNALERELAELEAWEPGAAELAAWRKHLRQRLSGEGALAWSTATPADAESANGGSLRILDDGSVRLDGEPPDTDVVTVSVTVEDATVTGLRLDVFADEKFPAGGPGLQGDGNLVLSDFAVTAAPVEEPVAERAVTLSHASASFDQQEWEAPKAIDGDLSTGWAISPRMGEDHYIVFELAEPLEGEGATRLTFTLTHNFGHAVPGHFRLATTEAAAPVRADSPNVPDDVLAALEVSADDRSDEQHQRLLEHYHATKPHPHAERMVEIESRIEALEDSRVHTLVMEEMGTPREARIHERGDFLSPGEQVDPGVPGIFHPLEVRGDQPDRLDLARWLVSEDNPATARVAVNRLWQQVFGDGLVRTPEDFGTAGARPTHRDLLDWLAVEFMDSGWDVQHILQLLVTSHAYRQSAQVDSTVLEQDPNNELLARGPRFRLDAEVIRDQALSVAGLLNQTIGGPSVYPHQEPGLWEAQGLHIFGMGNWPASEGADRYRRGMYTFWRRGLHYPTFDTFDAPSREMCTVQRARTNTPLQALVTMNEPTFVEAARVFAERIMAEGGETAAERITFGFRLCVTRPPTERELAVLVELYHDRLAYFAEHNDEAAELAAQGPAPRREGLDAVELAAWSVVANVLLNLDETVTKG